VAEENIGNLLLAITDILAKPHAMDYNEHPMTDTSPNAISILLSSVSLSASYLLLSCDVLL
jgi:hypothetical protein